MIPEELKQRLQIESQRIRQLARLTGDDAVLYHKKSLPTPSPLKFLTTKMDLINRLQKKQLIADNWIQSQAEVAKLHGLQYLEEGNRSRWIDPDDSTLTEEQKQKAYASRQSRSENYFSSWKDRFDFLESDRDPEHRDRYVSLFKVDLALLAHACKLPIDSFLHEADTELAYLGLFNQYLDFEREGKNLFAQDTSFLDQFSNSARGSIRVEHLELTDSLPQNDLQNAAHQIVKPSNQNKRSEGPLPGLGMRGVGVAHGPRRTAAVHTDIPVTVKITPPEEYAEGCELLALEKDNQGKVSLISSAMNMDSTTRFVEEEFVIPRLIDGADGDKPAEMIFNCSGRSRVYVLMLKLDPKGDTVLHNLPSFRRTTEEAYNRNQQNFDACVGVEDFTELRKILLQRDRSSWLCLHHELQILPANP
jgi:hypothetical protein